MEIYLDIFEHDYQDFINELKKFISRYNSNDILNIDEFEKIKNYLEDNFKISNYREEIFNKFFTQMHQGSSSIKFIKNKKAEHIKNLKEFLLEYEESDLSE